MSEGNGGSKVDDESDLDSGLKFQPRMFIQRYNHVKEILTNSEFKLEKVIDFGCSELQFIKYLKSLPDVREIAAVDIDSSLLEWSKHRAAPLPFEYLHRRKDPLSIFVYNGSVADHDTRLRYYDAVTCIELVEHLEKDVLIRFPETILGFIRPKIAVITTPNSDFNVLFPTLKGFRHWDHKFEWSREEFADWCHEITQKYPLYSVTIDGVGMGPADCGDVGYCTQVATFKLTGDVQHEDSAVVPPSQNTPYELVDSYEYPLHQVQAITPAVIQEEAQYYIRALTRDSYWSEEPLEVPLDELMAYPRLREVCDGSLEILKENLRSAKYELILKEDQWIVLYMPEEIESEESDAELEGDDT